MSRVVAWLFALALAACAAPAQQVTTAPAGSGTMMELPPLRLGTDLDAAPLGCWAEYERKVLVSRFRERIALVAKGPEGITLETTYDGKPFGKGRVVMATLFAPGGGGRPIGSKRIQIDDNDPTEWPVTGLPLPYPPPDPSTLVGTETVTVRAGVFSAKHYRDQTRLGEREDFWIDDKAWPIGLVKLVAEQKQIPGAAGQLEYELVAAGGGAHP